MLRWGIAAAVLLAAAPAAAEDWRLVRVMGDAPGRYAVLVDAASVDRSDPAKPLLMTAMLLEGGMLIPELEQPLHQLVSPQSIDCAANTITVLSTNGYDKAGTHLSIDDGSITQDIVAGQPASIYRRAACEQEWAAEVRALGDKPLSQIHTEVFGG